MIDRKTVDRVLQSLNEEKLRFTKMEFLSVDKELKADYAQKAADMADAIEIIRRLEGVD